MARRESGLAIGNECLFCGGEGEEWFGVRG